MVGFATICFKLITDEYLIWPLFRGNNSQRLPYLTDKHPEMNVTSYILAKNTPKHPQLGVGGGIMVEFSTIWFK